MIGYGGKRRICAGQRVRYCFLCSVMGLFQGTAAGTKNKLPGLITSMETTGAKALEEFADNIKVGLPSLFSLPGQAGLEREVL